MTLSYLESLKLKSLASKTPLHLLHLYYAFYTSLVHIEFSHCGIHAKVESKPNEKAKILQSIALEFMASTIKVVQIDSSEEIEKLFC